MFLLVADTEAEPTTSFPKTFGTSKRFGTNLAQ